MMLLRLIHRHNCLFTKTVTLNFASRRTVTSTSPYTKVIFSLNRELFNRPVLKQAWARPFSTSKKQYIHKDEFRLPEDGKRMKDKIPENYVIVYEADLQYYNLLAIGIPTVVFLLVASISVMSVVILGVDSSSKQVQELTEIGVYATVLMYCLCFIWLITLRQRCVVRMYKDKTGDAFIAVLRKGFFKTEKVAFKMDEARGGLRAHGKYNFTIKDRNCQVYQMDFEKYGHTYLFNKWFRID